jgi:diacylglycerol kinase (ATP)
MRMILDRLKDMQVTIIHNPGAGDAELSRGALLQAVREAGHVATYQSTKSPDYPSAVQEPGDVVLVAGGDGTLRRVALELHGRRTPVALLPLGTANNVAESLGISGGLHDCIRRLTAGEPQRFDIGRCSGARGDRLFVEGAGLGVIPELIRVMDKYDRGTDSGDGREGALQRAAAVLQQLVLLLPAFDCTVRIGGEALAMRLILLQVMNIPRIGPGIPIAAAADAADGELDVVWVAESGRDRLHAALQRYAAGETAVLECGHRRAAEVVVTSNAPRMHIDDKTFRLKKGAQRGVTFSCEAGRLTLLV